MKTLSVAEQSAYQDRKIIARQCVYIVAKNRSTGADVEFGFWTGIEDVTLDVIDGLTGSVTPRNFNNKGAVLSIGDISLSDNLNVGAVSILLSQLNATVEDALRTYDCRNAPIQIYRALFNPSDPTTMVDSARCRFVGYVDQLVISTPPEGGEASATLQCVNCTRELTRKNSDLRSDESQQRRHSGDRTRSARLRRDRPAGSRRVL